MITVMNRETCKLANIPDEYIVEMTEHQEETPERIYPYTRLHIVDPRQGHDYYLEVVESKKHIQRLIGENKNDQST